MKAVLVYQGGIANVFRVSSFNMADYGRDAERLYQGTFRDCEMFSRGLAAATWQVTSACCNKAGNITNLVWDDDVRNAPFQSQMRSVYLNMIGGWDEWDEKDG